MSEVCDIVASRGAPTLQTVIGIWEQVLQQSPIRPDDNFFDLGGDSLLALQLFTELERVTGCKLPITTIYDASTAAELAALVDNADTRPAFSPLVLLNDVPGGPPIFLIHGIGGNVMELNKLGKSIQRDRRVFAIQARGLDGIETAIESVEEMADYYLQAVRSEQPSGPYLLIGYSFGGMVALEMARRIEAAGEKVAFLAFVDAYPHPRFWPLVSWLDVRWRRAAHRAGNEVRSRTAEIVARVSGQGGERKRRGPNAIARPFMFDEDWPEAVRRVYDTSLAALSRYRPSGYPGSIVFFRAAVRSFYLPNSPERMWGGLLGGLEVVTVPGDHVDMVGRNATALGDEIARRVMAGLARVAASSDRVAAGR